MDLSSASVADCAESEAAGPQLYEPAIETPRWRGSVLRSEIRLRAGPGETVDNFRLLDHKGGSRELYYLSDMKAVVLHVRKATAAKLRARPCPA